MPWSIPKKFLVLRMHFWDLQQKITQIGLKTELKGEHSNIFRSISFIEWSVGKTESWMSLTRMLNVFSGYAQTQVLAATVAIRID